MFVWLVLALITAVSAVFGMAAQGYLDSVLPVGWETRLLNTLLIFAALYMIDRIHKLEKKVEQLDKALDRIWERTQGSR